MVRDTGFEPLTKPQRKTPGEPLAPVARASCPVPEGCGFNERIELSFISNSHRRSPASLQHIQTH